MNWERFIRSTMHVQNTPCNQATQASCTGEEGGHRYSCIATRKPLRIHQPGYLQLQGQVLHPLRTLRSFHHQQHAAQDRPASGLAAGDELHRPRSRGRNVPASIVYGAEVLVHEHHTSPILRRLLRRHLLPNAKAQRQLSEAARLDKGRQDSERQERTDPWCRSLDSTCTWEHSGTKMPYGRFAKVTALQDGITCANRYHDTIASAWRVVMMETTSNVMWDDRNSGGSNMAKDVVPLCGEWET